MLPFRTTGFLFLIVILIGLSACGNKSGEDPLLAEGERLFNTHCLSCHPTAPAAPHVGPHLVGLGENLNASGQDAAALLEESIRQPDKVITTGYQNLMPAPELLSLSDDDVNALVAYLVTLE
jgi:mono/diheme cytochrome c family protein